MQNAIYRIRKAIVFPWGIAFFFLLLLLLGSFLFKSLPGERLTLAIVFILSLCLVIEVFSRRISLCAAGLRIKKFLREKEFAWNDITYIGSVIIGKKVYILLTTTKGFYIISNNYENFTELLSSLNRRLSEEAVEKEIRNLIEQPLKNNGPVYSAWCVAVIVIFITVLRFYIYFSAGM